MLSSRAPIGLLLIIACACVQQPPGDPNATPMSSPQGEPAAQQVEAPQEVTPGEQTVVEHSTPSEMAIGDWVLELTPTQQRQYELLQLAFRNPPPTEADLAAMELQPDEQLMIGMVLMGREQHPDEATTPEVQRSLDELASASLTITEDSLTFAHGEELDKASYTVVSEETTSMVLETTTTFEGQPVVEQVNVRFDSVDRLQLWAEGESNGTRQTFVRREPRGGEDPEAQEGPDQPRAGDEPGPPPQGERPHGEQRAGGPGQPPEGDGQGRPPRGAPPAAE
jgi:hypothetical protein